MESRTWGGGGHTAIARASAWADSELAPSFKEVVLYKDFMETA